MRACRVVTTIGIARAAALAAILSVASPAHAASAAPTPTSPPTALVETRRFPWSPPAWNGLRWGMGIRDVARASQEACDGSTDFSWHGKRTGLRRSGYLVTYDRCRWDFLGHPTEPSFWFGEKGLAALELHVGERAPCAVVQPQFDRMRAALTTPTGAPVCLPYADGEGCRWRASAELTVWLFLGRLARSELTPELADPEQCNVFAVLEDPRQAPRTGAWEIPSDFPSATTDPATWGRSGFAGLRWGMGPDDVRRSVESSAPPLGGSTVAFCFQQEAPYLLEEPPAEVQCQFTLGKGPAAHVGTFTRRRLTALRLDFPEASPEEAAAATAAAEGAMQCRWTETSAGLRTVKTGSCVGAGERANLRIQRSGERTELTVEVAPLPPPPPPPPKTVAPPPLAPRE